MRNFIRIFSLSSFALLVLSNSIFAAPVVRAGAGPNAAGIQAVVDLFRSDLGGGLNPNNGQSFTTGRREINWDGVPDNFSEPNNFPPDFFNRVSPRGAIFSSIEDATGGGTNLFSVSSNTASGVPVRFGNINPAFGNIFQTFSPQRLFIARNTHLLEVKFFIPGTTIPATVSGFGAVFADVDSNGGGAGTVIRCYDAANALIGTATAPAWDNGLSFVGISFNSGERIARCVIESGNAALAATNNDGVNGADLVAMDDFIYGEPRALQFHANDFDGDGVADASVFRPSAATFFVLNSGNNTVSFIPFGAAGDIPVNGDFDGDQRADVAVFRPSAGEWWITRSSNGSTLALQFGANGDKPVVGDYDKDGKSDIAVWRPSNGNYFVMRSRDNFGTFFAFPFGQNGDIPVGAAIVP